MTVSQIMLQMKQNKEMQQEREKQRRQRIREQAYQPVDMKRMQNMKGLENVTDPVGGIAYGALTGLSEAIDRRTADLQIAQQYVQDFNMQAQEAIRQVGLQETAQDWFEQNKTQLQKITEQFPNMTPMQCKKALEPFYDDLNSRLGEKKEITDINPASGMISYRNADGTLEQKNIYDDFPEIKSRLLYNQGMGQMQITDQAILEQAQKEYDEQEQIKQAHLNAQISHQRNMEGLAREKFEYEKQRNKQAMESDVFKGNSDLRKLYYEDMHERGKRQFDLQQEERKMKDEVGNLNAFSNMVDELENLHNDLEKKGRSFLTKSSSLPVEKMRELIAEGSPTATTIAEAIPGITDEEIKFVQDYGQAINNLIGQFYAKYGEKFLGPGTRSDFDYQVFSKMMYPFFFSPGKNFKKSVDAYRNIIGQELQNYSKKQDSYDAEKQEYLEDYKPSNWLRKRGF